MSLASPTGTAADTRAAAAWWVRLDPIGLTEVFCQVVVLLRQPKRLEEADLFRPVRQRMEEEERTKVVQGLWKNPQVPVHHSDVKTSKRRESALGARKRSHRSPRQQLGTRSNSAKRKNAAVSPEWAR